MYCQLFEKASKNILPRQESVEHEEENKILFKYPDNFRVEQEQLKFSDHKAVQNIIFRNLASPSSKHPRIPDKHCLENYINSSESIPFACREYIIANDVHDFIESNLVQLQ